MFGTWKFDDETKEPRFVQYANVASATSTAQRDILRVACDVCRSRKLKCSGEAAGCTRCISMQIGCTYPSTQEARRRKHNSQSAKSRQLSLKSGRDPGEESESVNTTRYVSGSIGETRKEDDEREEYGKDLQSTWITPSDSFSTPMPMEVPVSSPSWSDVMDGIDSFTHEWDEIPGVMSAGDKRAISLLNPIHESSSASSDQALAQDQQIAGFSATTPSSLLDSFDSFMDSPRPINLDKFALQAVSSVTNTQTQSQSSLQPIPFSKTRSSGGEILDHDKSCRCLKVTAHLLEFLCTQIAHIKTTKLDELLHQYKVAVSRVSHILECLRCASRSELLMLLATVSERIYTICEKIVYGYLKHRGSICYDICFGSFKVTAPQEKHTLLQSLIVLQLKAFRSLVETQKVRAASFDTQLAVLQETENKLEKLEYLMKNN